MKTILLVRKIAVITLALASQYASAGAFTIACSYTSANLQECGKNAVDEIVTDKFTNRFPATQFQIFAHSHISSFTNGGYAAYAVVGVVPRLSNQFPAKKFSHSSINGSDKKYSAVQLAEAELKNYSDAVRLLMEQCEISPNCNVYSPR